MEEIITIIIIKFVGDMETCVYNYISIIINLYNYKTLHVNVLHINVGRQYIVYTSTCTYMYIHV